MAKKGKVEYYIRKSSKGRNWCAPLETVEQAHKILVDNKLSAKGYAVFYSKAALDLYKEQRGVA